MLETPEEREVFSAMEQSSVRKELIRSMDKYQSIMEELAVARMLIRELGDRLAKLEKAEPVAWMRKLFLPELGEFFDYKDGAFAKETDTDGWTPLYTTQPQRTWIGLMDEEIKDIVRNMPLVLD